MSEKGEEARFAYLQQMVEGASREELLLMLLDGALKFIGKAETAFDDEKWDEAHNHLCRVQDIFHELMLSLDGELGDAAIRLNDVYGFINNQLIQANVDHDRKALDNAKGLIEDVKSLWTEAVELAKGGSEAPVEEIDGKPAEETPKSINVTG